MKDGKIDQGGDYVIDLKVIVIDFELLYTIQRRYIFHKSVGYNKLNSAVIRYIRLNKAQADSYEIGVVGARKKAEKVIKDLSLNVVIKKFINEISYKSYLNSRGASAHLAIKERQYYSKNSLRVTQESF